ncbi:Tyrosine-protein kinase Src64B, partial [Stegodyphus mimosarum]
MGICCYSKPMNTSPKETINLDTTTVQENGEDLKGKLAVALFSLNTRDSAIISFEEGDTLIIEDDSDPDWFFVRHTKRHNKGFAPKSYLALNVTVGQEDWFFEETNRTDAERLLLQPENPRGTFMIRNSHIPGIYALSIKDILPETNEIFVRHYKIRTLDKGGFFISPTTYFATLKQLVVYYSAEANGLCCKLQNPCPRLRPTLPGPSPDIRDEYEIPYDTLQFVRQLGKGNFGEVFYGFWNGTLEVAIKCVASHGVQSEDFKREVAVMKAISHPKIVRLYAVCTEREPYCIIMEYMSKGNLQQYLKTTHGQLLKLPSLVNMTAQICDGMQYLESNNLIHRDLAARNILVGEGDIVKLADFGLARIMDEAVYITSGGKLPIKWTAPEAYTTGQFNIKSDVWSFGIVLYEIFTHGGTPYPGMKNQTVSELITKQGYRMPKPTDPECSDAVYEIMLLCWKTNPDERPTFEFLFNYFSDYYISSERNYREL